jgi:hypothetical protein
MRQLAKEIREAIRRIALPKPENETSLDELSEFFEDEANSDRPPQPGGDEDPEIPKFKFVPKRERRVFTPAKGAHTKSRGGAGGSGGGGGGGEGGKGANPGAGSGGPTPRDGSKLIQIADPRNVRLDLGNSWHRRIFFTPLESGAARVSIYAAGLESPEQLIIESADKGSVVAGEVETDLTAESRVTLNVRFSNPYVGPVEIAVIKKPDAERAK